MSTLGEELALAVQQDLTEIEMAITCHLEPYVPMVSHVAKYILFSGGKRIRPLLNLLSARMCGYKGDYDKAMSVVFEYLHAATLLHDDIVDDAEVRRGNPAAHSIWGTPGTVLVGDLLLARAVAIATAADKIEICRILTETTVDLAQGEIQQLLGRRNLDITEEQYLEVIRCKTSSLVQAACKVGGILADAPKDQVEALSAYGYNFGMAFQLIDDLLDYTAEGKVLGKTIGIDLQEGNLTMPLIHSLKQASQEEIKAVKDVIGIEDQAKSNFDNILYIIKKYEGLEYTLKQAKAYSKEAKAALSIFPPSKSKQILEDFADYALVRSS